MKPTKTKRRRTVDLNPTLLALLDTRQGLLEAEAGLAGRAPSEWIFSGPDGQPLDVLAVARRFRLLCRRAGLPRFRLYDLRHSYATHALALRTPVPYIAKQMGHTSPKTTMEIYAHWIDDGDSSWAAKIEEYQRGVARDEEPHPNHSKNHSSREVDERSTQKYPGLSLSCRGSSVAEQPIRKQPQAPYDKTPPDVNPGNQAQQP